MWLGIALFGPATVAFAYLALNPMPAIVVDSAGIKGAGVRRVAWDEIERISVVDWPDDSGTIAHKLVLKLVEGRRAEPATGAFFFRITGNSVGGQTWRNRNVVHLSLEKLELDRDQVAAEIERYSGREVEWELLPKSRWLPRFRRGRREST